MAPGEMTAAEAVDRTAQPVLELARGWMRAPATTERGDDLGLPPGRGFWLVGRAGVLGDVDADVVAAGVGFMAPGMVREIWEARPAHLRARDAATAYAACCAEWATTALGSMPEARLDRLNALARRVCDAALPTVGALFAGWRAMPQPPEGPAATALTLHVLRELRGGAHLIAVAATGLSPVDALVSSEPPRGGPEWAAGLGWPGPFPSPDPLRERRAAAERLTSQLVTPAFEVLDPVARAELVDLVEEARATCG